MIFFVVEFFKDSFSFLGVFTAKYLFRYAYFPREIVLQTPYLCSTANRTRRNVFLIEKHIVYLSDS